MMTTRCLAVTGGDSIGKCGRLSQPRWLLVRTIIYNTLTYNSGLSHAGVLTCIQRKQPIKHSLVEYSLTCVVRHSEQRGR